MGGLHPLVRMHFEAPPTRLCKLACQNPLRWHFSPLMVRLCAVLLLLFVLGLTVSCEKRPESASVNSAVPTKSSTQQVFQVKGLVVSVKPRAKIVEIKHE